MSYRTETDISRRTYLKLTGGASAVGLTGVAGCLGDGGDSTTITPGTAPGFPPFEMQEDGELVGFDIDLLEAVVDETEYELGEWATFEFDSLIPALTQNEEIDVIAAAMTITEDRQETIAFSDPTGESDQAILVREGGDFQPSAWEDFEGVSVGAQSGTTGADQVQSNLVDPGSSPGTTTARTEATSSRSGPRKREHRRRRHRPPGRGDVRGQPRRRNRVYRRDRRAVRVRPPAGRVGVPVGAERRARDRPRRRDVQRITNTWFGQE